MELYLDKAKDCLWKAKYLLDNPPESEVNNKKAEAYVKIAKQYLEIYKTKNL